MSITGSPTASRRRSASPWSTCSPASSSTVGILAALRHRDATGEGQLVEVDLLSALLAALVNQASAYTIAGEVPARMGNAHPSIAPYELLRDRRRASWWSRSAPTASSRRSARSSGRPGWPPTRASPTNAERVEQSRRAARGAGGSARRPPGERLGGGADRAPGSRPASSTTSPAPSTWRRALGLEPIVAVPREDGTAVRADPQPDRPLGDPGDLPLGAAALPRGGALSGFSY